METAQRDILAGGLDKLEQAVEEGLKLEGPPPGTRTLAQDFATLRELDEADSPDLLVLYYFFSDASFDCFNAGEYQEQMLRYYTAGWAVRAVLPRRIGQNEYMLVCLQSGDPEKDGLCQVAFQCRRQFCGISMLVKKRCFVCHKPGAQRCAGCHTAAFCNRACLAAGWGEHKKLCKLVKASAVTVETESVQLKPE
jgi:hypothetical protein